MFESNYNYVPNPYPPAPAQQPVPGQGWLPPQPYPVPPQPYPPQPQPQPQPVPPVPHHTVLVDKTLSIPGAAADAAVTGSLIASKLDVEALSGNIQLVDGKVELIGMGDAEVGQVPTKAEDGSILWKTLPSVEEIQEINAQIDTINDSIVGANALIDQLFELHTNQANDILALTELVNGNNEKVDELDALVQELSSHISSVEESKLDKEEFNDFLENYNELVSDIQNRLGNLEEAVEELQNCCQSLKEILGDVNNYAQPIYQTLQDFETHAQALARDFDGGDLDDEVETFPVPDVVGMSLVLANTVLGQHGFFTEASSEGSSYSSDGGVVVSQIPAANARAERGTVVELEVSEEVNG